MKLKSKKTRKKIIGRGGKRGGYSGRGQKGQRSRAGRKIRPEIRDVIKRLPKKRGYKFKSIQIKPQVINLTELDAGISDEEKLTPLKLVELKIVKMEKGKLPKIKILGGGKLAKKVEVSGINVSKTAREKIEKMGGTIK